MSWRTVSLLFVCRHNHKIYIVFFFFSMILFQMVCTGQNKSRKQVPLSSCGCYPVEYVYPHLLRVNIQSLHQKKENGKSQNLCWRELIAKLSKLLTAHLPMKSGKKNTPKDLILPHNKVPHAPVLSMWAHGCCERQNSGFTFPSYTPPLDTEYNVFIEK